MSEEKYEAIYRKFRPETFDEVIGQDHIVRVLKTQIADGSTSHAYLFCGTRGTGKTTMARLLAKGVNCLSDGDQPCGVCENCISIKNGTFVDVIEIDAASNNGVDNVRELRDSVIYPPSAGRNKVYIIDEVHMLTKQAFNALLKTLEEPPEHVLFILATTEASKILATIQSRCLRFDFHRIPAAQIMNSMKEICKKLNVPAEDDALALLASNADGSVRDGLSLLEQCVSAVPAAAKDAGAHGITRELVLELIGSPGDQLISELTAHVVAGQTTEALILLDEMLASGKENTRIIEEWIDYFHSTLLIRFVKNPERLIGRSEESIKMIKKQSEDFDVSFINDSIYRLSKLLNETRWSSHTRILLEMAIIEMSERKEL
ncbi:MAG: DNA polymerase III subunit gamma/tau [Clostridiales Family XIII bacterium]|nr:DNA polymerase III subunit gamma/tau [Clostridiales Family XIII bacterium]